MKEFTEKYSLETFSHLFFFFVIFSLQATHCATVGKIMEILLKHMGQSLGPDDVNGKAVLQIRWRRQDFPCKVQCFFEYIPFSGIVLYSSQISLAYLQMLLILTFYCLWWRKEPYCFWKKMLLNFKRDCFSMQNSSDFFPQMHRCVVVAMCWGKKS